jgi:hypothetical protein
MRWRAAKTRLALVAGLRRLAGTFELDGTEGDADACQLLSGQKVFAVPHAIRKNIKGERLNLAERIRGRRSVDHHPGDGHAVREPPTIFSLELDFQDRRPLDMLSPR